jgi:hypothetical protein
MPASFAVALVTNVLMKTAPVRCQGKSIGDKWINVVKF